MAFNDFFRILTSKRAMKVFLPISAAYFFFAFGWGLVTPIFSIFINKITNDMFLTGIILGFWGIVGLFSDIPFGILIDKVSPKKLMQISLSAYLLFVIGYTLATDFWTLLVIRIVHSFFGALMWISVWAYLYSRVEKKKAAQEIGLFSEFYDFAATIAPLIGGFIAVTSFFFPFYLTAIFCFVALFIITFAMPEQRNHRNQVSFTKLMKAELNDIFKIGDVFYYTVLFIILVFGAYGIIWGFIPVILNLEGIDYEIIGLIIAVSTLPAVLFEIPIGSFIDKIGKANATAIGLVMTGLCTLALSITLNIQIVIIAMFFLGIASVLLVLLVNTAASDLMPKAERGGYSGVITFFKDIGNFIGPIFGGLTLKFVGVSLTMLAITVMFFGSIIPLYFAFKEKIKLKSKFNLNKIR